MRQYDSQLDRPIALILSFCALLPILTTAAPTTAPAAMFDAQAPITPQQLQFFEAKIRPVLVKECYECHSKASRKLKGGLRLDSRESTRRGGDSGQAVVPGSVALSLIIKSIRHEGDLKMPDGKPKLPDAVIADFVTWIESGAPDPRDESSLPSTTKPSADHWAFHPPVRPPLPTVRTESLIRTPIDRFLLAPLEAAGRSFSAPAERRTLARRLYFDLIGLPPTPEELDAFLADTSPNAYEQLIDRLLASPRYGERWGRHWLDVAGWAESTLLVADRLRQGFWRYRDYVINAFNEDKPYDQFLIEQFAGDELADWQHEDRFSPDTIEKLTATGFLRCVPDGTDNQFIVQYDKRFPAQQQSMEVSTKAVLGLTLNCTRCHDHKFDPISQEEYFNLIAVFGAAYDMEKWQPGMIYNLAVGPVRAIPLLDRAGRDAFQRRMETLTAERDRLEYEKRSGIEFRFRDQYLKENLDRLSDKLDKSQIEAALAIPDRDRKEPQQNLLILAAAELGASLDFLKSTYPDLGPALKKNQNRVKAIQDEVNQLPEFIWALWDVSTDPTPVHVLTRGDFTQPGRVVGPGVIRVLDDPAHPWQPPAPPAPGAATTGRRLAFARWLVRPNHPLTARVMVNRIWQYHFGTGIVASPDDFGHRGSPPSHPQLLDWLATEFVQSGWSVKHMHRLIVNSTAYRQSGLRSESDTMPASALASFPRRRIEAEPFRDAMLSAAGLLDLTTGGPSIQPGQYPDGSFVVSATNPGRHRRSVYLTSIRSQVPTLLALFDAPAMDTNWPKRADSAIPAQSLAMMNHPEVLECAKALAARVCREATSPADRLDRAFRLTLSRSPDIDERSAFDPILRAASPEERTWQLIAHALLSCNEFLYVD